MGIGRINTLIFPIYIKKQAIGNCQVITRSLDLKEQGVNAGRIFNDKKLGIDLLKVIDSEKNVLEIISRIKK
jgi:hypothetical protein